MGDSRFHLKVDFEIYGEKFDWDASLNCCAHGGEIDDRITNWFLTCYEEAYSKYQDEIYKADATNRKKAEEAQERAELDRLKAKYETPNAELTSRRAED